jgi:hypothetical protein
VGGGGAVTLRDIPRRSKIYESCTDGSTFFIMDHPDGMYSFCVTEKGAIVHLGIMQELQPYADGYKFVRLEDQNDGD